MDDAPVALNALVSPSRPDYAPWACSVSRIAGASAELLLQRCMNRILFPLLLGAICIPFRAALALELVTDGQPRTAIVIPDKALKVVLFAAKELQYHVQRASGAKLPIINESRKPAARGFIYLGQCRETSKESVLNQELSPNGFVIKLVGSNLFMAGDDSGGTPAWILHNNRTRVGTLFAVYELLEKHLGVRWLWPGKLGEIIPKRSDIAVKAWDQTSAPRFVHTRWRDGGAYGAGTQGWSSPGARSKYLDEQSIWLRRHRFALGVNMDMGHAFTKWWEQQGEAHPEYFNLLPDGERRPDPTYWGGASHLISMCVSEPVFWKAIVKQWQQTRTRQNPCIAVSENDTAGKCTCEKCLAWDVPDSGFEVSFNQRIEHARTAFKKGDKDWYRNLGSLSDRYARFYIAVQKEAEKTDPDAIVMGYAYTNYKRPPLKTKLNDRIIIGIVPGMSWPFTEEKRDAFRQQWDGWRATGARLLLRPNVMLDGHNMPLFFARKLGEDFGYAARAGMIGTDFDSLTGQWSTQGPNLYVLARLHNRPDLPVHRVLDEYYSGFGKATEAVRGYFGHWEKVSKAFNERPPDLHWASFYREAHKVFTPEVMSAGRRLLVKAQEAAAGEPMAEQRVAFLKKGLKNAELTLATQASYRQYREKGDIDGYRAALGKLDAFRKSVESDNVANIAFLAWAEQRTWDRALLQLMKNPGKPLPATWKFEWDPRKEGEAKGWFADDFDVSGWPDIRTDGQWEQQAVGKQWKKEHGEDYNGLAWYRTAFELKPAPKRPRCRLIFGAVDEACVVWLNGKRVLQRPYPYKGNKDSWQEAFEVDVSDGVRYDRPNTLAVRVEDNAGAGGIWRPVWVVRSKFVVSQQKNLANNGDFERESAGWKKSVMCGKFQFAFDPGQSHRGKMSGRLTCTELLEKEPQRGWTRAWGRWYQTGIPVQAGKHYRLRLWLKTSKDFGAGIRIWVTGTEKGTMDAKMLNTEGIWREVTIEHIAPKGNHLGIYLNLMEGTGTVWFDDVELLPSEQPQQK